MNILRFNKAARSSFLLLSLFAIFSVSCKTGAKVEEQSLKEGWYLTSSKNIDKDGAALSSENIDVSSWTKTSIPATVLASLIEADVYKDVFYAKNLADIPAEPFEVPWWYRTTFDIDGFNQGKEELRIFVDGINYRANIWLNGKQVASEKTIYGAFNQFELDITDIAKAKGNILAIEIIPPKVRDFYMGFVDWAPTPPDHYMGIYREIRVKRSGKVSLDAPFVSPDVNTANLKEATLAISSELTNYSNKPKTVTVTGTIKDALFQKDFGTYKDITFQKEFTLKADEKRTVWFKPEEFAQLNINNPKLWWPNGLGKPEMHTLNIELKEGSSVVDNQSVRFGIRKVETYLNKTGARGYKINGREVLIKSGGWVDDLFLRYTPERDSAQIRYAKEMNMNSLRFEGVWGNNHHIYDLCDDNGILLMVGWSCQWEWPDYLGLPLVIAEGDENLSIAEGVDIYAVKLTPDEEDLLTSYLISQAKWLRNHPSIFCWSVGSDAMPKPSLEKKYMNGLKDIDNTRSLLVSCGEFSSTLTGTSGMKMNGPYEYVPPVYWFEDKKLGGAFGFNSETGPGPQVPPISSIKKMFPEEFHWPPANDMWNYHSGRKDFNSIAVYMKAMDAKYGKSKDLEEFAMKAQVMNYEAMRPMFEAFVVNRPVATGVVQWMYNSPWPEFYWQLFDYYLMPTGAYFGTQKACQNLNMIYDYHNHKVFVTNDINGDIKGYEAVVTLYDINSKKVFEYSKKVDVAENISMALVDLPKLKGYKQVYFLDLKLKNNLGEQIADNFYWLATKKDKLDWEKQHWFYTEQKQYADFTKLNTMKRVAVEATKTVKKTDGEWEVEVTLKNPSNNIAFFIELLAVNKADSEPILPVFWTDNYVSLVPGESKKITVKVRSKEEPAISISGYNIKEAVKL
jgi:exo-1,4-beta-D-glucosaminidase